MIKDIIIRMPYDQIGVEKVHVDGEDRFIVVLQDSQLRNPFRKTFDPESKEEAADRLRKLDVPEAEIGRLLAHAESAAA